MNSREYYDIFEKCIQDYHLVDNVDAPLKNPYPENSWEGLLYRKNWIDTVQWHLEDIIRRPDLSPEDLVAVKRRIDRSNQDRTDLVERLDDLFLKEYSGVDVQKDARLNTETPAWALDRLSILALKIYHMSEETRRADADETHRKTCENKLAVLLEQRADLIQALDELLEDFRAGRRRIKTYRQMKMYNDESLNPELYGGKKKSSPAD